MSEELNRNREIRSYLLGSLPEPEVERLDALAVSNDEFAEALQAAEKDLVDAYVQGDLSGADMQQFNSHYLSSPSRREKVEFARALRSWGEKERAGTIGEVTAVRRSPWSSLFSSIIRPQWAWGLAVAALVLAIATVLLVFQNVRLRQQFAGAQAQREALLHRERELQGQLSSERSNRVETEKELARIREELAQIEKRTGLPGPSPENQTAIVALVLPPPLRGTGQIRTLSIPSGTKSVATELQLESADYPQYRVMLIDPILGKTLWRSSNLRPRISRENRALNVTLPASLLKPQNYVLQVTGVPAGGGSEIIGDYAFRIVK